MSCCLIFVACMKNYLPSQPSIDFNLKLCQLYLCLFQCPSVLSLYIQNGMKNMKSLSSYILKEF